MKTSQKQFKLFRKEAKGWVDTLGLKEYEVHYAHEELEESLAQCGTNEQARLAKIYLNKDWSGEVPLNDHEVKKAAFHEVLELLLSRIRGFADQKNGTPEVIDGEVHRLIQIFINIFYEGK